MFRLVALTGSALADNVLDDAPEVGGVEVTAQPVQQRALDALVAVLMYSGDDLGQQRRRRGDVEAAGVGDEAVDDGPWCWPVTSRDLIAQGYQSRICGLRLPEFVDEVEPRR